ncbi:Cof-type HAD-IIB family hydrolase [Baaleninema simplex]|uniref:Cof-type HAD-IIB family hydrolase n=1 Tax=Baaleninema simplex TaxID=2862350 RepID=UPI00036CF1F8|nr:HAD family hydrolase [Baaleninema simplex]
MTIKLLVLDVDGTIAGTSNQIREPVKAAIRRVAANGVPVAIATGRMYRSALRFHREIESLLPLICYQGALIKDPTNGDRIHRHTPLCPNLTRELLDFFESPEWRDRLSVHFYIDDRLYVRDLTPDTRAYVERSKMEAIAVGDLRSLATAPTKVLALSHDTTAIASLLHQIRQRYTRQQLYTTTSVATFFEAAHPDVNKGDAVRYIAEACLGLRPENVMAVGDNWNDLEMLKYAGIGVAMGDAPDEVKAIADWVAPTVEADGVAVAIEQFLS